MMKLKYLIVSLISIGVLVTGYITYTQDIFGIFCTKQSFICDQKSRDYVLTYLKDSNNNKDSPLVELEEMASDKIMQKIMQERKQIDNSTPNKEIIYSTEYIIYNNGKKISLPKNIGTILEIQIPTKEIIFLKLENTGGDLWHMISGTTGESLGILNQLPTLSSNNDYVLTCTTGSHGNYSLDIYDINTTIFDSQHYNPYRKNQIHWDIESQLMYDNIVINSVCHEKAGNLIFQAQKCGKAYWNEELGQKYYCDNPGEIYSMNYNLKSKKLYKNEVEVQREKDFTHE